MQTGSAAIMIPEVHEDPTPVAHRAPHRLLPCAGIGVTVVAVLGHLGGGAMVVHLGLAAVVAYLSVNLGSLGPGAVAAALAAIITMTVLVVIAARHRLGRT
jgi:hypothetical protein